MSLVVRFNEYTRYDITKDCEVICFTGVTGNGAYHCEVPLTTTRGLRDKRNAFKERVIDLMESGSAPCEVSLA